MRLKLKMYIVIFGMTKIDLTIAIIQKTHHILIKPIRKSLANSKMKQLECQSQNSLVYDLKCTVTRKTTRKKEKQPKE